MDEIFALAEPREVQRRQRHDCHQRNRCRDRQRAAVNIDLVHRILRPREDRSLDVVNEGQDGRIGKNEKDDAGKERKHDPKYNFEFAFSVDSRRRVVRRRVPQQRHDEDNNADRRERPLVHLVQPAGQ